MTAEPAAQHTTPEARAWIAHVATACQDGCTIRDGGRTLCPLGAELYRAMNPDAALVEIGDPETRPSAPAETRDARHPESGAAPKPKRSRKRTPRVVGSE